MVALKTRIQVVEPTYLKLFLNPAAWASASVLKHISGTVRL